MTAVIKAEGREATAWTIGEAAGRKSNLRPFGSAVDQRSAIPPLPQITVKPLKFGDPV